MADWRGRFWKKAEPEQPAPQALSAPDSERAARAKAMTAAQVAKLLRWEAVCAHRMNVWQLDRAAELLEAQPAPQAGAAEPALRPDIQAVLLELDVPVQGYLASHAGTFLKHAAMMPPEEYPVPLVRESDHRRACRKIAALVTHPTEQPAEAVGTLSIQRFRGHLENASFDYTGALPDGDYALYTRPAPSQPGRAVMQQALDALQTLHSMHSEWHADFPEHVGDKEAPAMQAARSAIAALSATMEKP